MDRTGEKIHLYNTDYYIPRESKDAFRIESGTVTIYVAPMKNEDNPDRRIRLCEAEKGTIIPAFVYRDADYKQWRFIFAANEETDIIRMPGKATSILKINFLKKADVYKEHENFDEAIVEFYRRETLKDNIFISRGEKEKSGVQAESFEVIQKSFGSDEDRIQGTSELYKAVAYACYSLKLPLLSEDKIEAMCGKNFLLQDIASASGFALREVVLEKDWHKKDCGALIGTIDGRPVSCVPRGQNGYYIYFGDTESKQKLTADIAETVYPKAYSICRVLPGKPISSRNLFEFALSGIRKADLTVVALLGLVGALVGILLPTLNQKIYDDYIPLGNYSQLIQLCMVIATFMLGNVFFDIVKKVSEYRISSRVGYDLQNAIYFRVFRLPESFLRKQESADLAQRIASIPVLCKQYVDTILVSGLGTAFSLVYLYKMFKYAKKLSWFALGILVIYSAIVFIVATKTNKHYAKIAESKGNAGGKLYQLINGVDKLRMAGAEDRAIYQYLLPFSEIQVEEGKKNRYSALISVLSGSIATMFSMVFYFIIVNEKVELSAGNFMAFNSAFGAFCASILQLLEGLIALYQLRPMYRRIEPLIKTSEEVELEDETVGELEGAVSLKNVSFSYEKDGPKILNNISLEIKKGEYIGIVGASGCGKSTLLKLLLGFESPDDGMVCYDGKDIRSLNKRSLRKKLGVVLQNGQLIAGSIMENITITAPNATVPEVKKVVDAVGLARDIELMPMGLHTMLSENSGTISGGQKQRILIARAIINNPRILIMDEATSALDNITQAQVCSSLDRMNVTRIVVAHRLSTIKNCDRVIVLDKGRIVEEGNYDHLMSVGGLFYQLAQRQIVD